MPFGIQPIHIVVLVIIALLLFGPKSLPEVGRWAGRSISEFRKGSQEMTSALREEMTEAKQADVKMAVDPAPVQSLPADNLFVNGKFCTKCGSPNPSEALFCSKCGNSFQA